MTRKLATLVAALTAVPFAANAVEIRSATVDGVKIEAAVAQPTLASKPSVSQAVPVDSVHRPPQSPTDLAGLKLPVEQCQASVAQRC